MRNKYIYLTLSLFFIYSCGGGGGGAAPFSFTVGLDKILSTNEDVDLTGSFSASTNYTSNITYSISMPAKNGTANINDSGVFTYSPSPNYFGEDDFTITFSATQIDENQQPVGGPITYTRIVDVTVNPINDSPTITITSDFSSYDNNTMIFDDTLTVSARISDVDNDTSELVVFGDISNELISGSFTEPVIGGSGEIILNMNDLNNAGYQEIAFCVSDGSLAQCADGFSAYFISNKYTIDIENNCDADGANCSSDSHYVYYLVGSPDDSAATEYVFIGDRITSENYEFFRSEVLDSVNTLIDSDASPFIEDFFSIAIIEEVNKTGLSAFEIEAGCYPSTPTVYCIGDVSRERIRNAFDYDVAAFISSLSGRGVAQGNINIQQLSNGTEEVVMHELGHSHGYMGDEYDSGGERTFAEWYGDWSVNTTTVFDPNAVKWKHHIDFSEEIPGVDYDICYNYSDGTIYYRDELSYEECECFMNEYPDSDYPGVDFEPGCEDRIGLLEGTYYGEEGDYRSQWINIMWCCFLYYGPVNIDGFAIGSIMNQGFRNYSVNGESGYGDLTNSNGLTNFITLAVDAVYDQSKLKLKWFVDGVEKPEHENKLSVTFERSADNDWVSYSYQVEDLSGNLFAPNDPLSPVDFYEGNFERSYYYQPDPELTPVASLMPYIGSFEWYDPNNGWFTDESVNSSNIDNFLFAASCCSMGSTFKINWANYQQTSGQMLSSNNVKKFFFERPDSNTNQKVFNLSLSKDTIKVNSSSIQRPNPKIIKDPIIRKNDIYGLEFYNTDNELIYKLGIGDPFMVRLQHIDMEDKEHFAFEAPISNFNVVIPIDINPSYVSLIRRNYQNIYSEVSRYILN